MLHIYLFSLKLKSHSCIKHICALDSLYTNLYSAQAARQAQTATSNNSQVWQIVIFGNLWLRNENFVEFWEKIRNYLQIFCKLWLKYAVRT